MTCEGTNLPAEFAPGPLGMPLMNFQQEVSVNPESVR